MKSLPVFNGSGELSRTTHYTAAEVAEMFDLNRETVYRYARAGLWPHVYVGRKLFFSVDHVRAIVESQTHTYPAHTPGAPR